MEVYHIFHAAKELKHPFGGHLIRNTYHLSLSSQGFSFPQQQGKEIPDRNVLKFSMESTETSLPQLPRWGPFCAHLHHKPHDCSSSVQALELTLNQPWWNCLETPPDMGAGFLGKALKRDFPPQPCAGVLQKSFPTRQPKQPQTHGQWKQ